MVELGIEENLFVTTIQNTVIIQVGPGSITLKSEKGPHLAYFGEIHPAIVKNLDFKDKNILDLKYFKNILNQIKN